MEERKLICRIAQSIGEGEGIEKIKEFITDYANTLLLSEPELEDYALHLLVQFSPAAAWTPQKTKIEDDPKFGKTFENDVDYQKALEAGEIDPEKIYIVKHHIGGDIN